MTPTAAVRRLHDSSPGIWLRIRISICLWMPLRIWIGALGPRQQRVILSHGHFDQWGGLPGFLETHRTKMKSDLPIYLGGEDAFCCRVVVLPNGTVSPFGTLDRRELEAAKLRVVT